MSARGVITDFFDIAALEKQAKEASSIVQMYVDGIKKVPAIRTQIAEGNTKQSITAMNELSVVNTKAAESTLKVVSTSKILTEQQAIQKVTIQAANKEIINQAKSYLAASEAAKTGGETVEILRLKLKALTEDRDKKINILDPDALDKANQQIALIKEQLDKIEQAGGNFKGNVGNYTKSIDILKASLDKATASLQKMTEAGTQNNAEGQALAHEIGLLNTLVGQQSNGFSSLTRETSNVGKAVETIHEQLQVLKADGQQNSEAFQQLESTFLTLNKEFTDSKRKLNEFRLEQKILTDQTPKIAALTSAARGLGGIYATGAGAATLFAGENGHVQEKLQQLVAVMTLLQGLEEVHRLLTERNAIATALFGSTTATATVALEGEAAATEAAAVTSGALNRALALIAANPIILFLTALSAALIYLIANFKSEEDVLKENAKLSKEYSDSIKDQTEAIQGLNEIRNESLIEKKKDLEADLALEPSLARQLVLKKNIADIDVLIADKNKASLPDIEKSIKTQTEGLQYLQKQKIFFAEQLRAVIEKRKALGEGEDIFGTKPGVLLIEKAIEKVKELVDINNDAITSAKSAIDGLKKAKEDVRTSGEAADKAEHDQKVFLSEEERKLALSVAQSEVSAVQDKNNIILNNEHSTFSQRIAALKSNQAEAIKLAKAERNNIVSDPSKTQTDIAIAERTLIDTVLKIRREGAEEIRKQTLADKNRRLAAVNELNKSIIQTDSNAQETISKDLTVSIDDRVAAYGKYVQDQKRLVLDDAAFQKATRVLTSEETKAIDQETADRLKEIAIKTQKDLSDILVSGEHERLSLQQSADDLAVAKAAKENLQGKKGRAFQKAQAENAEAEFIANKKKLDDAIFTDAEILASSQTTNDAKLAASKDLNDKQAALYKLDADHATKAEQDKLAAKKKIQELEIQIAEQGLTLIQTLVDAGYTRQENQIQDQIDLIEKQKGKDIEEADQTITNAQDKADAIAIINAKAQVREDELNLKKRQTQEKQARFDKAINIAKIIQATAVAEIEALSYLTNPFTAALYPAIATLIGVLGAAQLAVAIATPIPKFFKGGVSPGGVIEVGDGGKSEGIQLPDGRVLKTPSSSTLVDVPKGSIIHPDFDRMMMTASLKSVPDVRMNVPYEKTEKALTKMGLQIVQAIKEKQENHWHLPGRYDTAMRDGSRFKAYLKTDL